MLSRYLRLPMGIVMSSGLLFPACSNLTNASLKAGKESLHVGFGTYFDGFGDPYGGCGVPQDFYKDDNGKRLPFIALNTQNTALKDPGLEPPISGSKLGLFADGKNCGRWIRFWPQENCKNGVQEAEDGKICIDPQAASEAKQIAQGTGQNYTELLAESDYGPDRYAADSLTDKARSGKPFYGIVADSCQDPNYWCRLDPNHIDIATFYLQDLIDQGLWNNRKVAWEFIDEAPKEYALSDLKFAWGEEARQGTYLPLVVYNTSRGVSKVIVNGKKAPLNGRLGQQFILPYEITNDQTFKIEAFDANGKTYGSYEIGFPQSCQIASGCPQTTPVPAKKI